MHPSTGTTHNTAQHNNTTTRQHTTNNANTKRCFNAYFERRARRRDSIATASGLPLARMMVDGAHAPLIAA
eukprot:scaffold7308_cov114-Isochrysis_galbana.AAC.10